MSCTSTSRSCRSCRCSCCASRRSVNVATFHAYAGFSPSYEFGSRALRGYAARLHGRIAVSAAARHFIDRFFPGDYKVIPNGVDIAPLRQRGPDRPLAGRHAECPVRGPPRAAQGPPGPAQGPPHPSQDRGGSRLLVVGSGPQEREARRYVATRGLQGVEFLGRVSDAEKAQLFRTADVYASPATGGESFGIVLLEAMAAGAPIVCSDIHGYKGVVRRGREGLWRRRASPGSWPSPSIDCSVTRACANRWAPPGRPARRSSAGRGSRPRWRTTTAS